MKKLSAHPALQTWRTLNDYIMASSLDECRELLQLELEGRCRKQFVLRIHHRINKLRLAKERDELMRKIDDRND